MKHAALELAERYQFKIIPVRHPDMGGAHPGKLPLIKDWVNLATDDPSTIEDWWSRWPNANIGIATGHGSGVFVLDVDKKAGGLDALEQLKDQIPDWPETLTAITGSGGLHVYFKLTPGQDIRNSASKIGPGLDIRGVGGFVVAPPSVHVSGGRYRWLS